MDLLKHSTRVAQSLFDCGDIEPGDIVAIEGCTRLRVDVVDGRVTLVPGSPSRTTAEAASTL